MTLFEPQHEHASKVVWQSVSEVATLSLDPRLQELVTVTGSLTRRLRDLCGGGFRLKLLGIRGRPDAPGLIREVLMLCGDLPWVFAQTVIPQSTLIRNPWLRELGNRPLGDSLFERPDVARNGLYLARVESGHPLYDRAVSDANLEASPGSLWARRSVIRIRESELSINEVFFPEAGICPGA